MSKYHFEDRNPATVHLLRFFESAHLPEEVRGPAQQCEDTAVQMAVALGDGPELTAGLRLLLQAKDCFVRQALVDRWQT